MLGRRLTSVLHLPGRRKMLKILGTGFLLAIVCWYFGADIWHATLLGCAITVIALALRSSSSASDPRDLSWLSRRARREGSRSDVAHLASSLRGRRGLGGTTAARQLQQIARRRLAFEGLDLDDAEHRTAIERRIGAPAYRALVSPRGRVPRLHALLNCLDMLDSIDSTHYPPPQPRARRWALPRISLSLGRPRKR